MSVSLILAVADNGVIGDGDQLPWHLSRDLRRFKQLTMGHHIVMGRKTFESIGRCLPGRTSIVITRQRDYRAAQALVAHDLASALRLAEGDEEIFIIGGAQIYRLAWDRAQRIYLTLVHGDVRGEVRLDDLDFGDFRCVREAQYPTDEKNQYATTFRVLQRQPGSTSAAAMNAINLPQD